MKKDYFNLRLRSRWFLVSLLAMLAGASPAWAQQALPYEYGFESSSSTTDGWTKTSCHSSTENYNLGVASGHGGSYVFRFYYNTNPPQYLISPELATSDKAIDVSFVYKVQLNTYEESFQVGYSTTDTETTSFTFGDEVKTKSTTWTEYTTTLPAGTKYVCIAYTANDKYYLYIDDFKVEAAGAMPKPKSVGASDITANSATLSWTSGGSETSWEISYSTSSAVPEAEGSYTSSNSITYNLTGLSAGTTYYIYVRAKAGDEYSAWSDAYSFTTDISCHAPTGLTVAEITSKGATLSWTSDADDFNVRYKKVSDADWTLVEGTISAKAHALTGLTPATAYQVQVRTYCDAADQSAWTDAASFTTDCAVISEFPFAENFNGITAGIPDCWNNTDGTTNTVNYRWNYYATGHDGACLRFNSYNNTKDNTNMLKTPAMNFPTGKTMQLTFWYKNPKGGDFSVFISNDGGSTYTTELATGLTGTSAWTQKEIILPADFTENVVIVFKGTSNYGNGDAYIYLDDVTIDEAPACAKPTALAASNVTANSVELNWTNGSDEEAWQIAYGTTADFNADETPVDVTTKPFTLTGLSAETTYYVCVRAKKGSDVSDWCDKVNFTTLPSCITPTDFAVSAMTINSATLTWTDATEQSKWEVSYSTTSGAPEEGTIVNVTEKSYTIESLTAGTTYYASVRAVNSDEDKSAWSSEVSFIPGVVIANKGTATNNYVPLYGNYADVATGTQTQFIIPSANLANIVGNMIDKIVFYSDSPTKSWGNAEFEVYMKAKENTTFESTTPSWDGMEKVYSGKLSVADGLMTIPFTDSFEYTGGNLMIGIKQTVKGTYTGTSWYGITTTENTAIDGYNKQYRKFLPKTAIYYSPIVIAPKMVISETELTYGLVEQNSEQTKTFTIENKGKADLTGITVSSNNADFTVTEVQNQTIAVGGEAITVTVTLNTETVGEYNGTITVSATNQEDAEIAVCGTVRDTNKVYESGFTALPADWTTTGSWYYSEDNGAYTTSWYLSNNTRLITPLLTINEGETFLVEAKGYSTSNTSYQHLQMQYSADGTSWTNFGDEPVLDPSVWHTFAITGAPAGKYYIAINASQADIRMFYGGELPKVAKMVVTQPASLDFGVIEEATPKTFTIANTGLAELTGISVASCNDIFTVTGAPTTLAAGASAEVTITMAATTTGAHSSTITVSATDMEDVEFTVTGAVLPEGMMVVDFNDNQLPANWNNASWTFDNGMATGKSSSAYLTTPVLRFSEGNLVAIKAQCTDYDNSDYIRILGSTDKGSTWTAYDKKITGSDGLAKLGDWSTLVLNDIPTTVNKLRFVGYYVNIDEIAGLTYAPILDVYKEGQGVAETSYHDFGECATDVDVTYNFTNYGGGTITITNVAITGEGATAYSTNWAESVAVPFDLVISRIYNAERVGTSEAVVTVTTTEGEYVINVTGSDKTANNPELTVSPIEDAAFGVVTETASKTYTVTNAGTGTLTVDIDSDNDMFTVVPAQLTDIAAGESNTFTVTFTPVADTYGEFNANIAVTPTYNKEAVVAITASAKVKDPNVWSEDFAANKLPTGWNSAANWTFTDDIAKATYEYGTTNYLTTPTLTVADAKEELTFDYKATSNYVSIKIQMSKDGANFADYATISGLNNGDTGTYTITGLEAGNYQFRFANDDYELDNFEGFKLNLPDHIMAITASSIPNSGSYNPTMKATQSFEATVTVNENRGVEEENVVAKLYMDEEVIGIAEAVTVEANGSKQITITATPTVAATEGTQMYIEVTYAGGTLKTEAVTRYVAEFKKLELSETEEKPIETGYSAVYDQVTLTHSFVQGWNTFIAPVQIAVTDIHAEAKALSFSAYDADSKLLTFTPATTLSAATPYVVYVPEAIDSKVFTWESPVIYSSYIGEDNIKVTFNGVKFQGTYAPMTAGSLTDKMGLTAAGKIANAKSTTTMKGFRAYFENVPAGARVVFDGTDEQTGIHTITVDNTVEGVYNLKGQKVNKPQKGGLYIINGRKVTVK